MKTSTLNVVIVMENGTPRITGADLLKKIQGLQKLGGSENWNGQLPLARSIVEQSFELDHFDETNLTLLDEFRWLLNELDRVDRPNTETDEKVLQAQGLTGAAKCSTLNAAEQRRQAAEKRIAACAALIREMDEQEPSVVDVSADELKVQNKLVSDGLANVIDVTPFDADQEAFDVAFSDYRSKRKQLGNEQAFDEAFDRFQTERRQHKAAVDVATVEPEPGLIDTAEAERMLALLGIGPNDPVVLCAYGDAGKGDGTNRYVPGTPQGFWRGWSFAVKAAAKGDRNWDLLRKHLTNPDQRSINLGFISSPGGTAYKSRQEVTTMTVLTYEIDTIPPAQQIGLWTKAGLPEPTCAMDTGGKSIHVHYKLNKPCSLLEGTTARKRLSAAINAVIPGNETTDSTMHQPVQPARLAGGIHPGTGKRSVIIRDGGQSYDLEELMAVCPELPPSETTERTGNIWRIDPEDCDDIALTQGLTVDGWDANARHLKGVKVPLTIALGAVTLKDITEGKEQGTGGRACRAWSISRTLQCAEAQLNELGVPFEGSAVELFGEFVVKSDLYCGDVDQAYEKHWDTGSDIGEGDLSKIALLQRLDEVAWDCYLKNPAPGGWLWKARQANSDEQKENSERRMEKKSIKSIQTVMEQLYAMEKAGLTTKASWADRQYKRSRLGGYRIRHEDIDRRLMEMVADEWGIRMGDSGRTERKGRNLLGSTHENEKQKPQIPGYTLLGRDALLAGQGGAGKTLAALGLSYQTATGNNVGLEGEEKVQPEAMGATLWIGTDGADGAFGMVDNYVNMLKVGMQNERKWRSMLNFWGADPATGETPWAFNVKGLHQLFGELQSGYNGTPYRLVVIDSLKAVMELGGLDFGIGPMGHCMRLIQGAAAKFNVSILWIHHLKPGAARSDMGIDSTGGNSNINQIPYVVHTLHKVTRKGHQHVVRWNVQKYRGEQARQFQYVLDTENGLFTVLGADEADSEAEVLLPIWSRREDGISTTELADCVDMSKKTLQKKLTEMGKNNLVQTSKKRWHITKKGFELLSEACPELQGDIEEWLKKQKSAPQV